MVQSQGTGLDTVQSAGTGPEPCQARLKLHQAPDIATDQLAFGTELSSLPTRATNILHALEGHANLHLKFSYSSVE